MMHEDAAPASPCLSQDPFKKQVGTCRHDDGSEPAASFHSFPDQWTGTAPVFEDCAGSLCHHVPRHEQTTCSCLVREAALVGWLPTDVSAWSSEQSRVQSCLMDVLKLVEITMR